MSMTDPEQFCLQWRGSQKGPWDLATIREALRAGDIHSMYQIDAGGHWQPLRDFLENSQTPERNSLPQPVRRYAPEMQEPEQPANTHSRGSLPSRSDRMDWKHVGVALILLLTIAAGGYGSYAIVKAISAPSFEIKASTDNG